MTCLITPPGLVFLFAVIFFILPGPQDLAQAGSYHTENVFIVNIDGLRNDEAFESGNLYIPCIWDSLRPSGTIYTNFMNRGITVTNAGHSTIVCGSRQLLPNNAGVETLVRPEEPTIGDYYRKSLNIPKEKVYYISGKNTIWKYPVSLYPGYGKDFSPSIVLTSQEDTTTWRVAQEIMDKDHPSLCYVLFAQVDSAGHTADSAYYLGTIRQADSLVFLLWKKIQSDPVYSNRTTLIVTSDHGRHDNQHGGDCCGCHAPSWACHGDYCHGCRHLMFLAVGPDIKADTSILRVRDQIDIAPTVAHLLGFTTPFAQGEVMSEMIVNYHPQMAQVSSSRDSSSEINISKTSGHSRSCAIARNRSGLHVVFSDNSNGRYEIYYARSTDQGSTWSTPQVILSSLYGDYLEPVISAIGDSALFVATTGYEYVPSIYSFDWVLTGKRSSNSGMSWETETLIDTLTTVSCKPSLTASGNNLVIAAMMYYQIMVYKSSDGGVTFTHSMAGDSSYSEFPACTLIDTVAYSVWQYLSSDQASLQCWNLSFDHEPWQEQDVALTDNDTNSYSYRPSLAADGHRNLHLVYSQLPDALLGNLWETGYKRSTDLGETWSNETIISKSRTIFNPVIKISQNGNVQVVWGDYSNNQWSVWGTHSNYSGAGWVTPYSITSSQSFAGSPDFVTGGDTLFLVWEDMRNGNWDIFFKKAVSSFLCGDANNDEVTTVSDVVYLINYLFKGGHTPNPLQAGDANSDGQVTISDMVYLINYLFKGGPQPIC